MQGQWRLIKLSGITHDWDAVIANVLGLGTATMLAWHALNHRLPFNRSLALSLLQFCLLIGTNGLIVDAMRTEWPDKLEVSACHMDVTYVHMHSHVHARLMDLVLLSYDQSRCRRMLGRMEQTRPTGLATTFLARLGPGSRAPHTLPYSFVALARYVHVE